MNETRLKELLICVRSGTVSVDEAARVLRTLPYEDLEFSKVDHHRELRLGFPEVIFGEGKSTENIIGIVRSVVGGLFPKPIIAVPTSVGYGANFKGLSALLGMLNSCAPGVAVVNIDNGFGAGYIANLINSNAGEKIQ